MSVAGVFALQAQGYVINMGMVILYGAISIASLALGIALIATKESKIAYALGIVGLLTRRADKLRNNNQRSCRIMRQLLFLEFISKGPHSGTLLR